ncbi:MAG: fimbria major subunit [Muribaculaceae bacterium]|nr:fimbria major subunit [Muribaculaceae bacterium]
MRKLHLTSGVLGLVALGLAACSHDDLQTPAAENNRTDIERSLYVNISIHGDVGETRAAANDGTPVDGTSDFSNGTGESAIRSVYFVFYDDNGNPVGDVVSASPTWKDQVADADTGATNSVEKVGSETLMVSIPAGQENPTQVVCYINPVNRAHLKNPLSTIQTIELEEVSRTEGTTTYFPMSNSVYYKDGKVVTATPLDGKVYDSLEEAQNALAANTTVNIYVERYATKLQMNVADDAVSAYETGTMPDGVPNSSETPIPVTLTFNYQGWELNGVANSTYPVKSFREASTTGQILPNDLTFEFLNWRINSLASYNTNPEFGAANLLADGARWNWNNADLHRSYWGCSPVYFQSQYPEVVSDYLSSKLKDEINQTFYSYKDVLENGRGFNTTYYFPETTSGIPALTSKNPAAAVPSVIIVGNYTLKVDGTELEGTDEKPLSFYTYVPVRVNVNGELQSRPSVYFDTDDEDGISSAIGVEKTMSMKKRFLWQASVFYKKLADGSFTKYDVSNADDLAVLAAITEVARPSDGVLGVNSDNLDAGVKMADRSRTLQISDIVAIPGNLYINNNGVPQQVIANDGTPAVDDVTGNNTQIRLDDANKILWMNVGTCNYYSEGRGFFNIPVKHTGWYRKGNLQNGKNSIDFSQVRVGDLGMVRNHAYSVNVSKIIGLATGVGGEDTPLIPAADTKDVFVAYRVNILKWAVVPTQYVVLE